MDVIVPRCAALDVHKDTVMAAVRTPGKGRRRRQVVAEFSTFTEGLVALRDWLVDEAVTQVAMEATGVYWKPVWHVLEDAGFELCWSTRTTRRTCPVVRPTSKTPSGSPSCWSAACCAAASCHPKPWRSFVI
jgi:hypothetical protein